MLTVIDRLSSNPNTAMFELEDPTVEPICGNSVSIYLDDTSQMLFGGVIHMVNRKTIAQDVYSYHLACTDYQRFFDRRMVAEKYEALDKTINEIIADIVLKYTDLSLGFTTNHVDASNKLLKPIIFNYRSPTDCLREMAELFGYVWYIDKSKDIHFRSQQIEYAPIEINDIAVKNLGVDDFAISCDYSQVRNRIFVQGGYRQSSVFNFTSYAQYNQTSWLLEYRPHNLTMEINDVPQVLGQQNVDTDDGSFDYFYNYYEKVVYAASGTSGVNYDDEIQFGMQYEIPVLARVNHKASQLAIAIAEGGDGIYEYVYKDNTLKDEDMVKRKAMVELERNAYPLINGSFVYHTYGFTAGQTVIINLTDCTYNGEYLITQVTSETMGNNIIRYFVEFEGKYIA